VSAKIIFVVNIENFTSVRCNVPTICVDLTYSPSPIAYERASAVLNPIPIPCYSFLS